MEDRRRGGRGKKNWRIQKLSSLSLLVWKVGGESPLSFFYCFTFTFLWLFHCKWQFSVIYGLFATWWGGVCLESLWKNIFNTKLSSQLSKSTENDTIRRLYYQYFYLAKSLPRKVKVGFRVAMASQPFWFKHPKCHFWYPKIAKKGHFGGTKNGTSGVRIKIPRPLYNNKTN